MKRIFILLLLVLLLPLRGWSAEGMAIQMSTDCAMMGQSADVAQGDHSSAAMDHKACKSCQLCMALVALGGGANIATSSSPSAAPAWGGAPFSSAEIAHHSKPPIL